MATRLAVLFGLIQAVGSAPIDLTLERLEALAQKHRHSFSSSAQTPTTIHVHPNMSPAARQAAVNRLQQHVHGLTLLQLRKKRNQTFALQAATEPEVPLSAPTQEIIRQSCDMCITAQQDSIANHSAAQDQAEAVATRQAALLRLESNLTTEQEGMAAIQEAVGRSLDLVRMQQEALANVTEQRLDLQRQMAPIIVNIEEALLYIRQNSIAASPPTVSGVDAAMSKTGCDGSSESSLLSALVEYRDKLRTYESYQTALDEATADLSASRQAVTDSRLRVGSQRLVVHDFEAAIMEAQRSITYAQQLYLDARAGAESADAAAAAACSAFPNVHFPSPSLASAMLTQPPAPIVLTYTYTYPWGAPVPQANGFYDDPDRVILNDGERPDEVNSASSVSFTRAEGDQHNRDPVFDFGGTVCITSFDFSYAVYKIYEQLRPQSVTFQGSPTNAGGPAHAQEAWDMSATIPSSMFLAKADAQDGGYTVSGAPDSWSPVRYVTVGVVPLRGYKTAVTEVTVRGYAC